MAFRQDVIRAGALVGVIGGFGACTVETIVAGAASLFIASGILFGGAFAAMAITAY
jgi:hypothetical protein